MKLEIRKTLVAPDGDSLLQEIESFIQETKIDLLKQHCDIENVEAEVTAKGNEDCCSCVVVLKIEWNKQ